LSSLTLIFVIAVGAATVGFYGQYEYTGSVCGGAPVAAPFESAKDGSGCLIGATEVMCVEDQHPQNCGMVNGNLVCVNDLPSDSCITASTGGILCGENASVTPDNGTPGSPVTPEFTITKNNGTTSNGEIFYYYSSSQVSTSSATGTAPAVPGGTQLCGGSG